MSSISTVKQLTVQVVSSSVMLAMSILLFVVNSMADRPMWITFPLFLTIPVLLVLIVCILYDLISGHRITIEGRLIEKQELYNGWKFRIRPTGEESLRTFRMNKQFDETFAKMAVDESIKITYYRLTRAVFALNKPDNEIEMDSMKD